MNIQKATFGNGCFWCTEAIFQSVKGVRSVTSGYTGGKTLNPTYIEVSNGDTGHAEAIELEFDAGQITYNELLSIFFFTHNPTTRNRQGNDLGTQYRSVIFYHNDEQQAIAEAMIKQLTAEGAFEKPIVTQVLPATEFYKAEDRYQDYYIKNSTKPYCTAVIRPKLNKFANDFAEKIRPELLQ